MVSGKALFFAFASVVVAQSISDGEVIVNGTPVDDTPADPTQTGTYDGFAINGTPISDFSTYYPTDSAGQTITGGITGSAITGSQEVMITASGGVTQTISVGPDGTFSSSSGEPTGDSNSGDEDSSSSEDAGSAAAPSSTDSSTGGAAMVTGLGLGGAGAAAVAMLLI